MKAFEIGIYIKNDKGFEDIFKLRMANQLDFLIGMKFEKPTRVLYLKNTKEKKVDVAIFISKVCDFVNNIQGISLDESKNCMMLDCNISDNAFWINLDKIELNWKKILNLIVDNTELFTLSEIEKYYDFDLERIKKVYALKEKLYTETKNYEKAAFCRDVRMGIGSKLVN
jgi:hypothetical protein